MVDWMQVDLVLVEMVIDLRDLSSGCSNPLRPTATMPPLDRSPRTFDFVELLMRGEPRVASLSELSGLSAVRCARHWEPALAWQPAERQVAATPAAVAAARAPTNQQPHRTTLVVLAVEGVALGAAAVTWYTISKTRNGRPTGAL